MLHAFALVHDDVMDGSALRRGHPTAHLEFSTRHAEEAWRGEPRRFGEGVAILVGDLAHVYADRLAIGFSGQALDVWNELRVELIVGQLLDMFGTAGRETDREAARLIARYKSGKYTIERPLHLGAALAERLDEVRKTLSAYGDPLGEAFQLRDDLLGAFGDAAVTGKPVGDDLREGKPTPLLATAVWRSDGNDAEILERVGSPDLTDDDIAALQYVLVDSGARADVEATIDTLADRAIAAVTASDLPSTAVAALIELAEFVAHRDR
jgi:geranylgeranyl diphosphate synthase type I